MARVTLNRINAALRELGYDAELVRGQGYFYLIGPAMEHARRSSIYIYALGHQPLEEWIRDCREILEEAARDGEYARTLLAETNYRMVDPPRA